MVIDQEAKETKNVVAAQTLNISFA